MVNSSYMNVVDYYNLVFDSALGREIKRCLDNLYLPGLTVGDTINFDIPHITLTAVFDEQVKAKLKFIKPLTVEYTGQTKQEIADQLLEVIKEAAVIEVKEGTDNEG